MKKIFLLLLSVGTIGSVFAQGRNDKSDTRDVILGNNSHNVSYNDNYNRDLEKRRKEAIDKVNRDFDFQVAAVKRNRYMSWKEKDRQVQKLERERQQKIREINDRFSPKNVHYNDGRKF